MTGKATLTTEPSIKAMLDPRMVATSTQTPTRGAQGVASGAERITPSSQGDFTKVAMFVRFLVPETGLGVFWLFQNGCPCVLRFTLYHSHLLKSETADNLIVCVFPTELCVQRLCAGCRRPGRWLRVQEGSL